MSEWWTYRPTDILLFSPQTYYRLFELYNREIWPLQVLTLLLGAVAAVLVLRGSGRQGGAVSAILAASWLWVAWAYHFHHYATINWAATWFGTAFAGQAALLIWMGVIRGRLFYRANTSLHTRVGYSLLVFALFMQPLMGPLMGSPWAQFELFGIAPDPTVVATMGVLLTAERVPLTLMVIPMLWCVLSGAMLWAMASPVAFIPPLAALLGLVLVISRGKEKTEGITS